MKEEYTMVLIVLGAASLFMAWKLYNQNQQLSQNLSVVAHPVDSVETWFESLFGGAANNGNQ